jgi:hypothetical protein
VPKPVIGMALAVLIEISIVKARLCRLFGLNSHWLFLLGIKAMHVVA